MISAPSSLKRTPLFDLHLSLGAKMVPFAGYEMPVHYAPGIIKEHLHTRAAAGLFDISHMGQIYLEGDASIRTESERLFPADVEGLAPGAMRYSFLLGDDGGTLDDLMIVRPEAPDEAHALYIVVNASCKEEDFALIKKGLPHVKATMIDDHALLALQGPKAAEVLGRFCEAPRKLSFMQAACFPIKDVGDCFISRSGYTGEDGFEISVPHTTVESFARKLLAEKDVLPIGLGARDSLRLEAGLCLYGHELDPKTTPIEAGLTWAIAKRRRSDGGFRGATKIQKQLAEGVARKRVGIRPEGRALAREQTEIFSSDGTRIGIVTSGGFGPSLDGPIAMGYVESAYAKAGTALALSVRGKILPATVVPLPFVPHRYVKG